MKFSGSSLTCSGQNNSQELRKLFLVPIDDVDLNPQHCLELLQLLRTFSPPQELFFLLMGQYELVQRCVELKMASQYAQLHKAADTLSDPDCGTLRQEVRRVAILNLRKMVPPHALCEIPARLNLQAAIDFRPIVTPVDKPPEDIGELLWKIDIRTSRGDVHHRFSTLGHLLLSPYEQPTRTETIGAGSVCMDTVLRSASAQSFLSTPGSIYGWSLSRKTTSGVCFIFWIAA
jgi:hypothetical protein